ncbi:MAG: hypothetical protein ACOX05_01940 [Bacillota bacterium]|jgi:hypothetical protein
MPKTPKILLVFLALVAAVSLLIGCSNTTANDQTDQQPTGTEEVDLASTYDLNTDKITIWFMGEDAILKQAFEITDPAEVQQMIESVDFSNWKFVPMEEGRYTGIPYYWVQFGDKTTISTYYEVPYGYVFLGPPGKNEKLNPDNGPYHMPQEFLDTLLEFVEKYQPEILP